MGTIQQKLDFNSGSGHLIAKGSSVVVRGKADALQALDVLRSVGGDWNGFWYLWANRSPSHRRD